MGAGLNLQMPESVAILKSRIVTSCPRLEFVTKLVRTCFLKKKIGNHVEKRIPQKFIIKMTLLID